MSQYFNLYTKRRPFGVQVRADEEWACVAGLIERTGKFVGKCPCCERHPVIITAQGIEPSAEDMETIK